MRPAISYRKSAGLTGVGLDTSFFIVFTYARVELLLSERIFQKN
jgi:hypothetical protein